MLRQIVGSFKLWFHTSTSGHNVSLDKVARLLEDLLVLTEEFTCFDRGFTGFDRGFTCFDVT